MPLNHIIFASIPAWGHIRPFCILAARLVREQNNVAVTFILSPNMLKKAEDEVASELRQTISEDMKKRIRIVSTIETVSLHPFQGLEQSVDAFPPVYRALMEGRSITCSITNTVYDAISPPTLAVLDFFAFPQFQAIRSISGKKVPILSWITSHGATAVHIYGPESMGGSGNLPEKFEAAASHLGIPIEAPGQKLWHEVAGTSGAIVKLPGVPEMYDYELFPQSIPFEVPLSAVFKGGYELTKDSDGILTVNIHAWEAESIAAMKQWHQDVHVVGPLLPATFGTAEQSNRGADDIKAFLDLMVKKKGINSVILISFGTTFWPKDTAYLEEVVQVMIDKDFPFILCHASPFSNLSDEFKEKVQASDIGFRTTWCPQQYILDHPATGWFLTHCGYNSVTEAIGSGVPLIAWPFHADQPTVACQLESLNLAIELVEVRSSEFSTRPLRRNGKAATGTREAVRAETRQVIDACRGPRGVEIRRNVEKLRCEFKKAWEADGEARKELSSFVEKYLRF